MLINTDNIIPKTELREKLSSIIEKVRKDKNVIAISDRGSIVSVMMPFEEYKKRSTLDNVSSHKKKKMDLAEEPVFGMWKDDPRTDEEILNTLDFALNK